LLVGLMLAGLFCLQCTQSVGHNDSVVVKAIGGEIVGRNADSVADRVDRLARADHIALLEYCLDNYSDRFVDYTCTLIKSEVIHGRQRPEQIMAVKFMDKPFSVAMKWVKNAQGGDRAIYVEGKYGNQMLIRPTGLFAFVGTVKRKPTDPAVMANTLRPINKFGFRRSMGELLAVYRKAKQAGDLCEEFGGYAEVEGRETVMLVRYLPAKDDYPAHRTNIYIDLEYLVPVRVEGDDWDDQRICSYTFRNLKFNVGLKPKDFLPQLNDMKPVK
jgi:hypothetical protein